MSLLPGTAPIKAEYLIHAAPTAVPDDDAADGSTSHALKPSNGIEEDSRGSGGPSRRKMTKEQKKAQRGANKGRRFGKIRDELDLCYKVAVGDVCEFGDTCRFSHDIPAYLSAKPHDLRIPELSEFTSSAPFLAMDPERDGSDPDCAYLNTKTRCPNFEESGECKFGFKCRFLGAHVRKNESGQLELVVDNNKKAQAALSSTELNFIGPECLKRLRSKKYETPITKSYLQETQALEQNDKEKAISTDAIQKPEPDQDEVMDDASRPPPISSRTDDASLDQEISQTAHQKIAEETGGINSAQDDSPDVPMRFAEKKRLHWAGKTYLAPLTTVGNLPFRRLCVSYGADITCGEMGLATSFLGGSKEEWSLVRRHPSESIFGVQVAGNKPSTLVPTAEIIGKEFAGSIDFVDVNCGCPIDLVYRAGSGSALLDAPGKLGRILIGMNKALGDIPVTVKLRTGVRDGRNTAHKLMPRLSCEWNVGCLTLHGRTRQQRYTRTADWDYIKSCVDAVRAQEADEDCPPVPIFGGGDCYSSEGYWSCIEQSGVDGVMIGRGALIKPWIFTEIKEHRDWDISASERLDLIKKYAEFGINHFGSDTAGVNTTRRYLCEALSFQYRYVPIGLLERLPGRLNDRPPAFRGRNELETLLASGDSADWVKISEMFLGPAPESWNFTPKHKSNAYGTEESQG